MSKKPTLAELEAELIRLDLRRSQIVVALTAERNRLDSLIQGPKSGHTSDSLTALKLSIRVQNILSFYPTEELRIKTIGELVQKTEGELLKLGGMGPKSLDEIKAALATRGLTLAH